MLFEDHPVTRTPIGYKEKIAKRAAREVQPGQVINLGIGIPTLIPDYLTAETPVWVHSENGILGMGLRCRRGTENRHTRGQPPGQWPLFSCLERQGRQRGGDDQRRVLLPYGDRRYDKIYQDDFDEIGTFQKAFHRLINSFSHRLVFFMTVRIRTQLSGKVIPPYDMKLGRGSPRPGFYTFRSTKNQLSNRIELN